MISTSPSPVAVKDVLIGRNARTGKDPTVQVALFDVNVQFATAGPGGTGPGIGPGIGPGPGPTEGPVTELKTPGPLKASVTVTPVAFSGPALFAKKDADAWLPTKTGLSAKPDMDRSALSAANTMIGRVLLATTSMPTLTVAVTVSVPGVVAVSGTNKLNGPVIWLPTQVIVAVPGTLLSGVQTNGLALRAPSGVPIATGTPVRVVRMVTLLRLTGGGGGGGGMPGGPGGGGGGGEAMGKTFTWIDDGTVANRDEGEPMLTLTGGGPESDDALGSTVSSGNGPAHPAAATAPSATTCNVPSVLRPRVIVVSPICPGAFVDYE
ncbi:MAG TPA: hypothetical protein VFE69_01275 [Ilumatobacteraceae bacterium]|nr:hypothetical protein [Ilumatobacteraceae bacterium]